MKKTILTEICIVILTIGISVGLYQIFYGIDLSFGNYFDMMTFELRRDSLTFGITSQFFLPIYISINIIRLIYYKFLKLYITIEITLSALALMTVFFLHYLTLGSEGIAPAKEGWIIHPPLSSLPQLNELDIQRLENERNLQLIKISVILILTLILIVVTARQKRKYAA